MKLTRWLGYATVFLLLAEAAEAHAQAPSFATIGDELAGDGAYLVDNVQLDFEDIVTSPRYLTSPDSLPGSANFYLGLVGVGVLFAGAFALDQTMKTRIGDMSHGAHDVMENFSYVTLISTLGFSYLYGLYDQDSALRQDLLTGGEAAGIGVLFNLATKASFGRLRPYQNGSHTAFFHGAGGFNTRSFTSNDMVIETAMATGLSEHFGNVWYVSVPLYSLALLEGFTRIGSGQQWFSDVVAGSLLGWGTAELLLWLHQRHSEEPTRWRIVPIAPPPAAARGGATALSSVGFGALYTW